ncbi:hypothetical protein E4T43_06358 [Aureobasidium subglaciale]|nr:hypothetical protein E4T43_06358 [Aureobasidium subglaciale]
MPDNLTSSNAPYLIAVTDLQRPEFSPASRPNMQHDTMPAPMFTHSVPTLPPKDPDPADIHLDPEITNDTTRFYDSFAPVKARLSSVGMHVDNEPAERDSKDTHKVHSQPSKRANQATVKDQTDMNAVETAPGADEQPPTPASTDTHLESVGTQKVIDTSEGVAEADDHAPVLERPEPISPIPSDISDINYTTRELPKDAPSDTPSEVANAVATAGVGNIEEEPVPTSAEPEDIEPEIAQVEIIEAEIEKRDIVHPKVVEAGISEPESVQPVTTTLGAEDVVAMPGLSKSEIAQPADSYLVPGQSTDTEMADDHTSNKLSAEDMSTTDDPYQQQDARRLTSPTCEPAAADDSSSETAKSSDTNEQVAWLRHQYQSFEEGRSSENEKEKVQEESATNAHTPAYTINNGIEDTKTLEDNGATGKTSKSTLVDLADSTTVVMPRISLFGGPSYPLDVTEPRISLFGGPSYPKSVIGPQKSRATEIEAERVAGLVATGGLDSGFDLFGESEDAPIDLTRSLLLEEAISGDVEQFGEWNFDFKLDVEADTEAGAEEDHPGTANDSDHDAKPDVEILSESVSPAASQVSQKSATLAKNLVHFITSESQCPPKPDNANTEILNLSGKGIASGLVQSMLQPIPLEQRCYCVKHPCKHDLNLRPRDKKKVANYGNVYDNDPTSDFEEYPNGMSASRIAREDMDEDESDNDDADAYSMTGGLETRSGRMNDVFEKVPYNQRDSFIRDKNTLDDESSDDEVFEKPKPKKRKRAKQTSSRPSKKAKSNKTKRTIKRARESDDEDLITTQDDNGEVILIKETKESKETKETEETKETKKPPGSQTIAQIMQRLATPHTTKLSYPITFNSSTASCSFCNQRSYTFTGCGSRKIKVYDYGNGLTEIPNANEAGLPIPIKRKPAATNLCMACTTQKMAILMCKTHSMAELNPVPYFDKSAAFDRMIKNQPAEEGEVWCSICPLPALHSCSKNCGAKFCETCAIKVHTNHHEDLRAMLQATKDEITAEYRYGLRADVALLRGDGELIKFMKRHSKTNKTA